MAKMRLGGITMEVGPRDVDFYLRAGYKQVVEEVQAVEELPAPQIPATETQPEPAPEPTPEPVAAPVVEEVQAVEDAPKRASKKVG